MIECQWYCEQCNKFQWTPAETTTETTAPVCCGRKMQFTYSWMYTGADADKERDKTR